MFVGITRIFPTRCHMSSVFLTRWLAASCHQFSCSGLSLSPVSHLSILSLLQCGLILVISMALLHLCNFNKCHNHSILTRYSTRPVMSGTGRSQYLEPFNQIFFRAKFINFFLLVRELTPGPRSVWPNIHLWDRADSEGSEGELGQDDPLRCYLLLLFSRVRQSTKIFWNNISNILFRFVMSVNSDQLPWNTNKRNSGSIIKLSFFCLSEINMMQLWLFSAYFYV